MPANIIVGCGGSGIKTILRFNQLLAEDQRLRETVDNDYFYVAVDTEAAQLNSFESTIKEQMRGVGTPYTATIYLSKNLDILQPLVDEYFVKPFAKAKLPNDKLNRLLEHWWWEPDENGRPKPFRASQVSPLTKGAGQCPPISYFLAWSSMEQIEREFKKLLNAVIKRHPALRTEGAAGEGGAAGAPMDQLNFCLVASLAGGTGRGCWQLLSFKIRQMLNELGKQPRPAVFLYDAEVFKNHAKPKSVERLRMCVNSLTGFSEISAWMGNVHGKRPTGVPHIQYSLPNMANPSIPVIKLDEKVDELANSPAHNTFLIFGRGTRAVLDVNDQYHDMVGNALYGRVANSAIENTGVNTSAPYASVAAAVFEVPASSLRVFFEAEYSKVAAGKLTDQHKEPVTAAFQEFLAETSLDLQLTSTDQPLVADERGDFLAKAFQVLINNANGKKKLDGLKEALAADNPDDVYEQLAFLEKPMKTEARGAVKEVVDAFKVNPVALARQKIERLLKDTGSVLDVQSLLTQLGTQLETDIRELPAKMAMSDDANPKVQARALSKREYGGLVGRHFNDEEIKILTKMTEKALLYWNYEVLRDATKEYYDAWREELTAVQQRLNDVVLKACTSLARTYEKEGRAACDKAVGKGRDPYEMLFAKAEEPEKGILSKFDTKRFHQRTIKPVMSKDGIAALLELKELPPSLVRKLGDALYTKTRKDEDPVAAAEDLAGSLKKEIDEKIVLSENFMEDNFSIEACVKRIRQCWEERLTNCRSRQNVFIELEEQFRFFFGVDYRKYKEEGNDKIKLPEPREFILDMCASLAATCDPYWELKAGIDSQRKVTVFPPKARSFIFEKAQTQEALGERLKLEVNVPGQENAGSGNPFVILAYADETTNDITQITSLNYWEKEADIYEWLCSCEQKESNGLFAPYRGTTGIGYIDPTFVASDQFVALRWRPWWDRKQTDEVSQVEAKASDTERALVYALLEPTPRLKEQLDKLGWSLPLIGKEDLKRLVFLRRAYLWEDGKALADSAKHWKQGQLIAQGISRVYDVLAGKGKGDGAAWRDRILEEEKLFWETVAPSVDCGPTSASRRDLLRSFQSNLGALRDAAEPDDAEVWDRLVNFMRTTLAK